MATAASHALISFLFPRSVKPQFERLVEDMMPDLHQHFREQRIEIHMFASQWFLTLFATKVRRCHDAVARRSLRY